MAAVTGLATAFRFFVERPPAEDPSAVPPGNPAPSKAEAAGIRPPVSSSDRPDLIEILRSGTVSQLTPEEVETFLDKEGRTAANLAAASLLTGDPTFLAEAGNRFPDDSHVALAVLSGSSRPNPKWIDVLKRDEPGNTLGYLFAADQAIESGSPETAFVELLSIPVDSQADLHLEQWGGALESAYLSAGYDKETAAILAKAQTPLPLMELKDVRDWFVSEIATAEVGGEPGYSEGMARIGLEISRSISPVERDTPIVVGLNSAIFERDVLHALGEYSPMPDETQRLVMDRLVEIEDYRTRVAKAAQAIDDILPTLSDSQVHEYFRRIDQSGELAAMEWLAEIGRQ